MRAPGHAPASSAEIHCGRCGHGYEAAAFHKLAPIETLEAKAVNVHVLVWPSNLRVEVRACTSCGQHLARRALDTELRLAPRAG